ncbi:MAG TPA: cation transporter [Chloroflexi bacterium]|nr:cation transporter [Chloroflexota bacterium]HHW87065.1 cation diffusion facilitator family transporter [Chloroflexota bacterium]
MHGNPTLNKRFLIAIGITLAILVAEIVGGLWTGSLALLADAGHVFLDVFALVLSFAAMRLSLRPADSRHTFGYHRFQVLAAFINGATLLLISFEIFREAWARWQAPEPILAGPMLVVAVVGLVANLLVAFTLHEHDHDDLNTRSAFLHVLGDAISSVGVIAAGAIILFTGWYWVDPLVSVLIGVIILLGAWRVLRESTHILNEGMPNGVTAEQVQAVMQTAAPGISNVHDLHVWTIRPGFVALSAHVVLDDQALSQAQLAMDAIKSALREHFAIEHTTIQFECDQCNDGALICTPTAAPATLTAHDHDHGHADAHDHSHAHATHDTHDGHVHTASLAPVHA